MDAEAQLKAIAADLSSSRSVPPVTVREFLSWFLAQRRGYSIVNRVRAALEQAGLTSEPDFESAYIDSEIHFRLVDKSGSGAVTEGNEVIITPQGGSLSLIAAHPVATKMESDPTYRISKLKAAQNSPLSVAPTASVVEAVSKMLTNHFSQLPVMTSAWDLKGIISWQSIGARMALGKESPTVKDMMDEAAEIRADASFFQAIPIIAEHQYVLVRALDRRIVGIITSSDLNHQFQQLAEPFLQLGEIENQIRRIIDAKFLPSDLMNARDPADTGRVAESASDLSFGEYVRLLQNPTCWDRLGFRIDRPTFCGKLEAIRIIRNDVMHFDPDGIPPEDLDTIREFSRFLQDLQRLGVT